MKIFYLVSFFVLISLSSCQPDLPSTFDEFHRDYIVIGHCYDWTGFKVKVDTRIEKYALKQYDEIWLGGDICAEASAKRSTLEYIDGMFDLSSEKTLWAVGNHDLIKGHKNIKDFTGRDFYYTQSADGITKIVLNTNLADPIFKDDCDFKENQMNLINSVLDTIKYSTHLVMLMHGSFWDEIEENMGGRQAINASSGWVALTCEPWTQFVYSVFPKLQEIQAKGIQVVLVSGDGGQYSKKYYYKTQDGIECYITGINNSAFAANPDLLNKFNNNPDSILIFHHDLKAKTLTGEFIRLY